MIEKQLVGEKAADYVKDGMVVGLGTGSTVYYTLQALGKRIQEGLAIKGIPTSRQTEELARQLRIPLVSFADISHIDLAIDGADEIDRNRALIKGGGGALLREKIIANASNELIVIADSKKMVHTLGVFPLPIEVVRFGWEMTAKHIRDLGCVPRLRLKEDHTPFITDNSNYIIDAHFHAIEDPHILEQMLNSIPGVVENGLFVGMTDKMITVKRGKIQVL
ncbi:ribose 5-phosphate isomerase A [Bacillus iocasae]|uniref:Ribose-5-phosphate isomerase A n=1 Tax=Priestia iocasae TaxID=2291674 RepID=A0ABS2QUJ5_9BACI|nr:ribose-5-phosphate isomerase RpiA [Metabacillus iocasae]MBM7702391.1 ribose 5-phosphate isomerase A [Metabacillus iocasae]